MERWLKWLPPKDGSASGGEGTTLLTWQGVKTLEGSAPKAHPPPAENPNYMNKYYVYIIKSESYGTRYVGSTNNVNKRLLEHNNGRCRYTKGRRPWELLKIEEYVARSEAMAREKFLKSGKGRKELDEVL